MWCVCVCVCVCVCERESERERERERVCVWCACVCVCVRERVVLFFVVVCWVGMAKDGLWKKWCCSSVARMGSFLREGYQIPRDYTVCLNGLSIAKVLKKHDLCKISRGHGALASWLQPRLHNDRYLFEFNIECSSSSGRTLKWTLRFPARRLLCAAGPPGCRKASSPP